MTPDKVVKECIDYLEKFKNNITDGVGREKTLTYAHKQLKIAISLLQDYQKLRERVSVEKHCRYQRLYPRCALDQTICDEEDCKKRKV
jgi:hypothetical protein